MVSAMVLFGFGPDTGFAIFVDFQVNDVGVAANGAVFDVILRAAGGKVDGDDNFFAARVADVAGFIVHGCFNANLEGAFWGSCEGVSAWGGRSLTFQGLAEGRPVCGVRLCVALACL